MKQYQLLDSGNGYKLERFGPYNFMKINFPMGVFYKDKDQKAP